MSVQWYSRRFGFGLCLLWLVMLSAAAQSMDDPFITARNAHIKSVKSLGLTPSNSPATTLEVTFDPGTEWPALIYQPRQGHWNWQAHTTLQLPVENLNSFAVSLFIRLNHQASEQTPPLTLVGQAQIPPKSQVNIVMALQAQDARAWGMRGAPPPAGLRVSQPVVIALPRDQTRLDQLTSLHVVVAGRSESQTLRIGPIALSQHDWGKAAYQGLIDRYGQSTRSDWPEKVHDDAGLKQADIAPLTISQPLSQSVNLAATPQNKTNNTATHSVLWQQTIAKPSGFFSSLKHAGRWWLVTPEGKPFFSLGVNTVDMLDGATYIEGREWMFTALPSQGDLLSAHYGQQDWRGDMLAQAGRRYDHGRFFNFYTANLQRKYGVNYLAPWLVQTATRLQDWGFNTIGNWSHAAWSDSRRMPYTQAISIQGQYATVKSGFDYWGAMPDPYDPRFVQAARQKIDQATQPHKANPLLLGYFVDNELSWGSGAPDYSLAVNTLVLDQHSPAKQAMIALLKRRYPNVAAWATAWHINVSDWQQALQSIRIQPPFNAAQLADLSAFTEAFAETYFRVIKQALLQADPHHLYLGSRFAALTPEALRACSRWCDVMSINIYSATLQGWQRDHFQHYDKPILIGEFNFGSADRGPFWAGLIDVGSETARGEAYARYLNEVAHIPNLVGAHWFQYLDQPASGRLLDGENAHFGLVSIADVPYTQFVQQVKQANRQLITTLSKSLTHSDNPSTTAIGR